MTTISLRLRPGVDDDLKTWWENTRKGDRSDLAREALRDYVQTLNSNKQDQVRKPVIGMTQQKAEEEVSFRKINVEQNAEDVNKKVDALIDNLG